MNGATGCAGRRASRAWAQQLSRWLAAALVSACAPHSSECPCRAAAGDRSASPETPPRTSPPPTSHSAQNRSFTVFFPDTRHPDWQRSCGALSPVKRSIPAAAWSAESVLRMLLAGPIASEQGSGLEDPFAPAYTQGRDEQRLEAYLQSVRLEGNRAIISFAPPALHWLNGSACVQEAVKQPIVRTLRASFSIADVDWAIDGVLFDEWDA